MKSYKFKIQGHEYEVEIKNTEGNIFDIEVNGTPYTVELDREIKQTKTPTLVRSAVHTHKTIEKTEASGASDVKCPLPGIILNIFVKVGDQVKAGDQLIKYEAMKMENILTAEKSGTISSIKVNLGDTIIQDQLIMQIK